MYSKGRQPQGQQELQELRELQELQVRRELQEPDARQFSLGPTRHWNAVSFC